MPRGSTVTFNNQMSGCVSVLIWAPTQQEVLAVGCPCSWALRLDWTPRAANPSTPQQPLTGPATRWPESTGGVSLDLATLYWAVEILTVPPYSSPSSHFIGVSRAEQTLELFLPETDISIYNSESGRPGRGCSIASAACSTWERLPLRLSPHPLLNPFNLHLYSI